jgi:hypothetical protein
MPGVKPERQPAPKWQDVFIELALRAIRKVHYEHQVWSCGQWFSKDRNSGDANRGHGIETADERAVCSAVTQEFMSSQLAVGPMGGQDRYWEINREKTYSYPGTTTDDHVSTETRTVRSRTKTVDIWLLRWYRKKDGTRTREHSTRNRDHYCFETFIEAKRAYHWKLNIAKGTIEEPTVNSKILDAVEKLCQEMRHRRVSTKFEDRTIYCYLLIWGTCDFECAASDSRTRRGSRTPREFLSKILKDTNETFKTPAIRPDLRLKKLRWLPLAWTHPNDEHTAHLDKAAHGTSSGDPTGTHSPFDVTRALWVMLVEVRLMVEPHAKTV